VHITRTQLPLGFTFGLGIEQNRAASYYTGLTWLFGDAAALTIGPIWGQTRTLPAGVQGVGTLVTDPNVANNVVTRTKGSWFVGLSYRFIGGANSGLRKPFLGETPPTDGRERPARPAEEEETGEGQDTDSPQVTQKRNDTTVVVGDPVELSVVVANGRAVIFELEGCTTDATAAAVWLDDAEPAPACASPARSPAAIGPEPGKASARVRLTAPGLHQFRVQRTNVVITIRANGA
jgi:hypothetical protein